MNLRDMTEADFNAAHNSHFAGRAGQGPLRVIHEGDPYQAPETIYNPQRFDKPAIPLPPLETPRGCTGNCSQGRACDCVPDIDDNVGRDPRIPEGGGLAVAFLLVAGIVICVLALSYVVRVL